VWQEEELSRYTNAVRVRRGNDAPEENERASDREAGAAQIVDRDVSAAVGARRSACVGRVQSGNR
jgi:hypothetical protein